MFKRGERGLALVSGVLMATGAVAEPLVQRNPTVVPHDQPYYQATVRNTELIFTEKNRAFAEHAAGVEQQLQPQYEASFGYQMDSPLFVGLISDYNQIANGFSTQYPQNRQINYVGGAAQVDYFTSTSWLDTLLYHETAHNYQVNAKDNAVSRNLHDWLGNGSLFTPLFPAIIPNTFASSFMLEGNAVMNEARHGNGGRLYSGRFDALVNAQARAGYLTPERAFNRTLYFPFGEASYVLGGAYQYHLAEQYGVDQTNRYFLQRSRYWYWPLVVNAPLRAAVGTNFDDSFADWATTRENRAGQSIITEGEPLVTSKYFTPLNRDAKDIYFLASPEGVRAPFTVALNRQDQTLTRQRSTFRGGKLLRQDGELYSVASGYSTPWRIYQGLFDKDGMLEGNSKGQIIQGYMTDGRAVYFDVASSYDQPQLYVGETFYRQVNSSVQVHGDDLYYFVQQGNQRTLYRNQDALYAYPGYYGIVADVDSEGAVYFIANSEYGSSLFRVNRTGNAVSRVLAADDVIDARLVTDEQVLATAVQADHYGYYLQDLSPRPQVPYHRKLLWDRPGGEAANLAGDTQSQPLDLDRAYHSWTGLRYSGTQLFVGAVTEEDDNDGDETDTHLTYSVQVDFADPLDQNRVSLLSWRDADLSDLAGLSYSNNQFFLLAGVKGYWVLDERLDQLEPPEEGRDQGLSAQLRLPLLQEGYWYSELSATYYQDYHLKEREPLAAEWSLSRTTQFGNSWLPNKQFAVNAYQVDDRDDTGYGGSLTLMTDLPHEFYLGARGKVSRSDARVNQGLRRGVELDQAVDFISNDPSAFVIPALEDTVYAQQVRFGEASVSKVINLPLYSFKVPLSLRREALHLRYRHYDIDQAPVAGNDLVLEQGIIGLDAELLLFHNAPFQVGMEYAYSDGDDLTSRNSVSASLGVAF